MKYQNKVFPKKACFVILSEITKQPRFDRSKLDRYLDEISIQRGYFPDGIDPFLEKVPTLGQWALIISKELPVECERAVIQFPINEVSRNVLNENLKPEVFFISCYTSMLSICFESIEYFRNKFPSAKIIVGGPHANFMPDSFLDSRADIVWSGEIDGQLHQILKQAEGMKQSNTTQPIFMKNTSRLLTPNTLDWKLYLEYSDHENRQMPRMMISRDCIHKCSFCVPRGVGKSIRERRKSLDIFKNDIREYRSLKEDDLLHIRFTDPDFLWDAEWNLQVVELLYELDVTWDCQTRIPNNLKSFSSLLPRIRESGCRSIFFGIESTNQRVLKLINKNYTAKNIDKVLEACTDEGIMTLCNLLIGLPGQNKSDVINDVNWACKALIDGRLGCADILFLMLMPGTEVYNDPEKFKIAISSNFSWMNLEQRVQHSTDQLSTELIERLYEEAIVMLSNTYKSILSI
ncbi:MAG: B12-binding domain-containing radical SAM protein [Bacteroidetes bacterium]|jgi:anaerobic magnesium-protoporphyrin IX monomethyl ester cyclase|nr:B12-binding domain-containing radical SAM protein [Bacteroidota bacterium]